MTTSLGISQFRLLSIHRKTSILSSSFGFAGNQVRVGRQVVNRRRKMLDEIMNDPLYRQNAQRDARLVDDREMAIAALFHPSNARADRIFGRNPNETGGPPSCPASRQHL